MPLMAESYREYKKASLERLVKGALVKLALNKRRVLGRYEAKACIQAGYVARIIDSKTGVWFTDKGVEYLMSLSDADARDFFPLRQDIAAAKARIREMYPDG